MLVILIMDVSELCIFYVMVVCRILDVDGGYSYFGCDEFLMTGCI